MPFSKEGKEYFENAIKESFVIVSKIDDKVVGYLLGEVCDIPYYDFKIAELWNMCIDSNYCKQGIGNALYKEFERTFREQGITHFTVTASFKNKNAKSFYKKMGFEEANSTFTKF